MYKLALISIVSLLVLGCATQAQRQFQAIQTGDAAAAVQLRECATAVYNSPEYAPIRPHLPANISDATLDQLSNSSFVTAAEWQSIVATHPRSQQCRKSFLEALSKTEPSLVPIFTTGYNRLEDDLLALSAHQLTWGQYTRRARDRVVELQAAVQTEQHRVVSELQEQHEVEMAQRQRAAEALAAWAQTQQLINAANQPVVTNCNSFGSMVNCVTR